MLSALLFFNMGESTGNLGHRIELFEPVSTRDRVGQEKIAFTPKGSVWASVTHLKGSTFFAAQQTLGEVVIKLKIRKNRQILATWRIAYESKQWQILDLDQTDRAYTYLMATTDIAIGLPVNG